MGSFLSRQRKRITLGNREIQLISFFEEHTGSLPRDCFYDKDAHRVTFIANSEKQTERIIGRHWENNRSFRIDVIEYSEDIKQFITNCLFPARISSIRMEKHSGKEIIHVSVSTSQDKGHAIGARSWKMNRARFLLKRHFGICDISITIQRNNRPLRTYNGDNEFSGRRS